MNKKNNNIEVALELAAAGIAIFPVVVSQDQQDKKTTYKRSLFASGKTRQAPQRNKSVLGGRRGLVSFPALI
jgi:hypothetical protein